MLVRVTSQVREADLGYFCPSRVSSQCANWSLNWPSSAQAAQMHSFCASATTTAYLLLFDIGRLFARLYPEYIAKILSDAPQRLIPMKVVTDLTKHILYCLRRRAVVFVRPDATQGSRQRRSGGFRLGAPKRRSNDGLSSMQKQTLKRSKSGSKFIHEQFPL